MADWPHTKGFEVGLKIELILTNRPISISFAKIRPIYTQDFQMLKKQILLLMFEL